MECCIQVPITPWHNQKNCKYTVYCINSHINLQSVQYFSSQPICYLSLKLCVSDKNAHYKCSLPFKTDWLVLEM